MRFRPAVALVAVTVFGAAACDSSDPAPSTTTTYNGTFTGQMIVTTTAGTSVCLSTRTLNGTLKMTLTLPTSGTNVTGTAETTGTLAEIAVIPAATCSALQGTVALSGSRPVNGTTTNLVFSSSRSSTTNPPSGGSGSLSCTDTFAFAGALAGSAISGTLTYATACTGTAGASAIVASGTIAIPVTLR